MLAYQETPQDDNDGITDRAVLEYQLSVHQQLLDDMRSGTTPMNSSWEREHEIQIAELRKLISSLQPQSPQGSNAQVQEMRNSSLYQAKVEEEFQDHPPQPQVQFIGADSSPRYQRVSFHPQSIPSVSSCRLSASPQQQRENDDLYDCWNNRNADLPEDDQQMEVLFNEKFHVDTWWTMA